MTSAAFAHNLGQAGNYIVAIAVIFFALSTVLGWAYYGERCAVRLFGIKIRMPYRVIFTAAIMLGAMFELSTVWTIADILNGLMALPNLIGLLILSGLIARETRAYLKADPDLRRGDVPMEPLRAVQFKGFKVTEVPIDSDPIDSAMNRS
jgi:AGCS family alanine or glycine:cation symporter